MKRFRYILVTLIIVIASTAFAGCTSMKASTDVNISLDGSSEAKFRVSYDDNISKVVGDGILIKILENQNISVKKYKEDNMNIEEVVFSTNSINIKDLLKLSKKSNIKETSYNVNEYININYKRNKGLFKDSYTVYVELNKDVFSDIQSEVSENLSLLGESILSNYLSENISQVIGSIDYDIKLSIPFDITDSNATTKIDSKTVKWNLQLKDLNKNNQLIISFSAINVVNIIVTIVIILILIILFGIFIRNKIKNNN